MRIPTWMMDSWNWIDQRTGASATIAPIMDHHVPRNAKWWYVFGSATLMFFILQITTGICLALLYVPSAGEAYQSLIHIDTEVPLGWMIRGIHGWSSNAMVLMMLIHMCQVFLHGTYKFPRELTWIVGVFLLFGTLALAFTGQVLRWDQDSYWGLGIGAAMMGRIPWIGPEVVNLVIGGPIIAGETLSRWFSLHVFVLPGFVILMVGLHIVLILKNGISEMPEPGAVVDKATYREGFEQRMKTSGVPFFPEAAKRDMIFCGLMLLIVIGLAFFVGPFGPLGEPDPTMINTNPKPDFFFLWIFAILALLPPSIETYLILASPVVIVAVLILLPFISNEGERAPSRRPVAVITLVLLVTILAALSQLGVTTPWSPKMDAWTSDTTPRQFVVGRSPTELQGAILFQYMQCRNCHELAGIGGQRGPELDDIATRMTRDQLIRQVQQGGGNMPAFGKNLDSAQTAALAAFLQTLTPDGEHKAVIPAVKGDYPDWN
ncbi:MAG: cytochrome B6 [Phycisphaerae bacterium]|nr:cytochrome B6 [Phycisphaerae bacterium]